jgi:hypothetical protein
MSWTGLRYTLCYSQPFHRGQNEGVGRGIQRHKLLWGENLIMLSKEARGRRREGVGRREEGGGGGQEGGEGVRGSRAEENPRLPCFRNRASP